MGKKVIQKAKAAPVESVLARVFMNGGSQAVRIPAAMRVPTEQVRISFDEESGKITIEPLDRDEMKAAFIEMARSLTSEERDEFKAMKFKRVASIPRINPTVAEFFREAQ